VIVVDNSVLVAFWLPGDFAAWAESAKERDGVWAAPVVWRAEFRTVLAGYLRKKRMTEAEANAAYANAQKDLGPQEFTVPTERILQLVLASDCPADACEYVALAQDLGVPLVTTDQHILREFPKFAVSLERFAEQP
jgi:predicted nucleic acid-binding protein